MLAELECMDTQPYSSTSLGNEGSNNFNNALVKLRSVEDAPLSANSNLLTEKQDLNSKNKGTESLLRVTPKAKLHLEADYFGVISFVDIEAHSISASIYDKKERVELMEIEIPFSNFKEEDHCLFESGAVFYWQVGKKETFSKNKRGHIKSNQVNISQMRMRRAFVDMSKQEKRIENLSEKYRKVLSPDR